VRREGASATQILNWLAGVDQSKQNQESTMFASGKGRPQRPHVMGERSTAMTPKIGESNVALTCTDVTNSARTLSQNPAGYSYPSRRAQSVANENFAELRLGGGGPRGVALSVGGGGGEFCRRR